ncbi:SGNH/GDSL hydrolase family protein [Mesorhizobium sp. M0904]|uniref:SGNH/GDSL hydrolase family protein n=1 Tax=Mesorhizobium sp. M0904 TaxID=2957022 RepID=UPI003335760F
MPQSHFLSMSAGSWLRRASVHWIKTLSRPWSADPTETESRSILAWFAIACQLALFIALVYLLRLETTALVRVLLVALAGWCVHYFLPQPYRLPFFVLLSFATIAAVFANLGPNWHHWRFDGLIDAAWIVAIGLVLIGIVHLPIAFGWRVLALVGAGCGLAAARMDWIATPWTRAVWPVLASMFMFRLIVYAYEMRREQKMATLSERLAYFFMLPNVCFPLFPVVDFRTFRSSYYNADRHYIYQTGIQWMFRGAIHLICYRIVYQRFVIDAADVHNQIELLQFIIWPFLLYLKVSGTFHIITGILHLFGFNLPETHNLYFLSSSFTDFWRRINIYWKDFIMKIVYYPLYFRFRRWGESVALVSATLLAFLATWLLHNYQWFWLRGTWVFTWNDFLFWMILAVLVTINAHYEMRHGRTRRLRGGALSWNGALQTASRTIGVFVVICLLWSFWSASSVPQWFSVFDTVGVEVPGKMTPALVLVAVAAIIGIPALALARGGADRQYSFRRSVASVGVCGLIAVCISLPMVHDRLGETVSTAMADIRAPNLNSRDNANLERGYYENLVNVGAFNPELWIVYGQRRHDGWDNLDKTPLSEFTGALPTTYLRPLSQADFKGTRVHINRWGMRDQDYEKIPTPGTPRIAIVGSSHVFGEGVADDETFEGLLERRLNAQADDSGYRHYEVLNFAVGGYVPLDILAIIEDRVLAFKPKYIFYFEHSALVPRTLKRLGKAIQNGSAYRYDFVRDIVRESGIDPRADHEVLQRKLMPYGDRLLRAIYSRIVEAAKREGVGVFWIYLPRPDERTSTELEKRLATEAGFNVLDLSGVYDGYDWRTLLVAPWDDHPNAAGHRLIADKLYQVLQQHQDLIPLNLAVAPHKEEQ